jgi:hypothetical protein
MLRNDFNVAEDMKIHVAVYKSHVHFFGYGLRP